MVELGGLDNIRLLCYTARPLGCSALAAINTANVATTCMPCPVTIYVSMANLAQMFKIAYPDFSAYFAIALPCR